MTDRFFARKLKWRLLAANGSVTEMANGPSLGIEYLHSSTTNGATSYNSCITHHGRPPCILRFLQLWLGYIPHCSTSTTHSSMRSSIICSLLARSIFLTNHKVPKIWHDFGYVGRDWVSHIMYVCRWISFHSVGLWTIVKVL